MHDSDNPEGLFVRRVGNQVFAYQNEAHGPRSEVRAFVALIGKWNQSPNGCENFRNRSVGGVEIIRANELPNLVEVNTGFRVKVVSGHEPGCERRAAALFSRK